MQETQKWSASGADVTKLHLGLLACMAVSAGCSDDSTPFELGRSQKSVGVETSSVVMQFLVDGQPATEVQLSGSYAVRATVSGLGAVSTGTVTIRLYGDGDCTGTIFGEYVQPVNADGIAQLPFTYPANSLGTAYFQGTYSGDDVYSGAISTCGPISAVEEPSSSKQTPVIIVSMHDGSHQTVNSVAPNTPVHPQVSVIGNGSVPTGVVGFLFYSNATCSGLPNSLPGSHQLDANGESDATVSVTSPIFNGPYSVAAYYGGDDAYEAGQGCISFTVSRALPRLTPDISLEVHNAPHQEVAAFATDAEHHPKATVTGTGPAPTGTLEFNYYHNGTCSGLSKGTVWIQLDGSGDADAGGWPQLGYSPGTHSWSVAYPGDGAYDAGQRCVAFNVVEVVVKATPTVVTTIHNDAHQAVTAAASGANLHPRISVTGDGPLPRGFVDFFLHAGSECSGESLWHTGTGFLDGFRGWSRPSDEAVPECASA